MNNEEMNEMTYETVEETKLEPVDYETVEDESEESEKHDHSGLIKGGIIALIVAAIIAILNRKDIEEKRKEKEINKMKKLAKKYGFNVSELEEVIEAECKEVDSEEDDCETEEEEN